jgi:hypothetical protein
MGVLSFGDESDTVFLRNAILRMIVSRAQKYLLDPADIEALHFSQLIGAILLDHPGDDQWVRLVDAVYKGTQDLKHQVTLGMPTEEPVRPGIQEKLDEILALISCYRCQDPEIWSQ